MLNFINRLMTFAVLYCILTNGSASDKFCGTRWIDDNTHICCNENIYDRIQNSKAMACCNHQGRSKLYAVDEKICCGGHLTPNQPHLKCCNKELIEKDLYSCCGGESFGRKYSSGKCCVDWDNNTVGVHDNPSMRSKCCSTMLYSKDTERCTMESNGQKSIISKTMQKCGTTRYDTRHKMCCSQTGKTIPKPAYKSDPYQPDWVCWNGQPYDSKKYYLDEKSSEVILHGLAPCGKEKYSQNSNMICCVDKLIPLSLGKNQSCCGDKLWDHDDSRKTCCNGTFIPTATKACCNDVVYDTGYDIKCCAKGLYNKTTDICCESQSSYYTITPKQKSHHTNCCMSKETGKMKTYNKHTEECVRGDVQEVSKVRHTTILSTPTPGPTPGRNEKPSCPFCRSNTQNKACDKKYVYKFFVFEERKTPNGTIMSAVILEPYLRHRKNLNGEKIKIRTRHKCECFKPRRNFYLFTNRKIKSFKENRYNIRFTSADVFIRQPEDSITKDCVNRLLLLTHWKELEDKF